MLMAGVQGNWYMIDVNNQSGVDNKSGGNVSDYAARPFEVGIYVQDKMEFQGMIANIGLRLDMYNPNVSYYKNIFAPFDYVDSLGVHHFEPLAPREPTSTVVSLQPRAGFSFPISVNTVFHVNYGTFLQRPTFDQILSRRFSRLDINNVGGASSVPQGQTLGNPKLKPQTTNSYDIGVTQALGEGFTLDVSGYYKDVKDLVQRALFYPTSSSNAPYLSYINLEYASIRGFRLGLANRRGMLTGTLNYTYGVATGKRSSADAYNYPTIYQSGPTTEPLPQDVLLDFDRTHNLIANLAFTTPEEWGPRILDVAPLDRVTIALTSFLRSGRPYSSWLNPGTPMNKRAPNETTTNVKITKNVSNFFGAGATLYVEISNLFNDRIYDYNAVFNPDPGNSANLQRFTVRYEKGEDIKYYDNENFPAFLANQEFRIFSNAPRSWTVGMVVNF
jgi:outer membrane receptor protein involved in Fe transport